MRTRILIIIILLSSNWMIISSQDSRRSNQPKSSHSTSFSSRSFNRSIGKTAQPTLFTFPSGGGQDDFDDSGAGDNNGGFNDPAIPVEDGLILMLSLSMAYFIWKTKKMKKIFNNSNKKISTNNEK